MAGRRSASMIGRRSRNPYALATMSPSMLSSIMQQETRGELLAESRSLLPDEATLSKAIMDRELFAGDKARYINGMNQYTNQFLDKYKKDPYYAFTNDARGQIKKMKALASDPALTAMEQAKITSDAEFKRATDAEMQNNPVVENGRVLVNRNGTQRYIPLSQLTSEDRPLSVTERYNNAVNQGGGTDPITYDMSPFTDVIDKVTSAATNLGTIAYEQRIGHGLINRVKSQVEEQKPDWSGLLKVDYHRLISILFSQSI